MAVRPPSDWHFSRPQLAKHYLDAFDLGLVSAYALYARRRMGKTEFLMRDLAPAAGRRGYAVGYCNLWQEDDSPLSALVDALTQMTEGRKLTAKIRSRLASHVSRVALRGRAAGMAEGSAEVEFKAPQSEGAARLRQAFKAFDEGGKRGLLLMDEAQVLADARHESVEKALRALLDTRKDQIKVVFTGSSEDRLRRMFGVERKAFYNWAHLEPMPLLGEEFALELTRRANALTSMPLAENQGLHAFDALHRVPELFRRFLAEYLASPFEGVEAAVEACRQSLYSEEGFARMWSRMAPADRLLLQLVAQDQSDLHGLAVREWLGHRMRLGREVSRSVPQNALRRLRNRQILIQADPGRYRFEDEVFRDWILATAPLGELPRASGARSRTQREP
jgi:hypothetical protein